MPAWVWIPIVVAGAAVVAALIYAILRRGVEFKSGRNAIVVHGRPSQSADPLGRALAYVPRYIGRVQAVLFARYLKAAVERGIDREVVTQLEDSRFAELVIRNAVALGNGSSSAQKIIENEIVSRDYIGRDVDGYVAREVVPMVVDAVRRAINDQYDSVVHESTHTTRSRVVSAAEFVDVVSSRETADALVEAIKPFFAYATRCLKDGCIDHD